MTDWSKKTDEELMTTAAESIQTGHGALKLAEASGRARLVVVSPGARIRGEDGEKLFERFYRSQQTRASREGHGLGLPLARHIAGLHGGDVRCLSGTNEDATFELDVPAWCPEPKDPQRTEP